MHSRFAQKKWTQDTVRQYSKLGVKSLQEFLSKTNLDEKPLLMITHFPPMQRKTSYCGTYGLEESEEKDDRSYFAWPDNNVLLNTVVATFVSECIWASGHTGFSYDFTEEIGKSYMRFVSNCIDTEEEWEEDNTKGLIVRPVFRCNHLQDSLTFCINTLVCVFQLVALWIWITLCVSFLLVLVNPMTMF